ncbi:glycosyltransferase family 2 protein [Zobellella maritima]|uniref:glycosyltransferase family 2 protein n=1 Tax=Zobellella maritima TaxID=2059725 RepID=UPI00130030ED|nr:glycosyltransferase family 2 protein [Zobellella maritima]
MLIRALLKHQGSSLEASLITEDRQGNSHRFALPVTLKGTLLELVYLPKGARHVWLELKSAEPVNCAGPILLEPVSLFTSRMLMWHRVLSTLFSTPLPQRRARGLSWAVALFSPRKAYRLVGKARHFVASPCYPDWIALCEQHTAADRRRLKGAIKRYALQECLFGVVIDARTPQSSAALSRTLTSLDRQLEIPFRSWVLTTEQHHAELEENLQGRATVLDAGALPALSKSCRWLLMLAPGTELAPWALAWMAVESRNADIKLIYPDHDYLMDGKRINPQFKPDWSEELERASGYVGDTFAVRADVFHRVLRQSGFDSAFQLVLDTAALAGPSAVCHIPAILCHQRYCPETAAANQQALENHLSRLGVKAGVALSGDHLRIHYRLPQLLPKVSIVIPTRDALRYLKTCVDSVLRKTSWPDFEILVVDNQSSEPGALAYLEQLNSDPRVRVLRYNQPFNFSAINNYAAQQAKGTVLCLLNNDTEVISPDWLEEMVSRLLQPGVGVVGARLYFSNGRLQHAGDVLGPGGCATHLHGVLEPNDPGYMHRAVLPQDLSAVTAACLVTRRNLYLRLGGLNSTDLPVAFNDVDYCLRIREAGWRVIYTPYAELYHHESVSRGQDDDPEKQARAKREVDYMRSRWGHVIERDPFYNPNLNYSQPDFNLGKVPRVAWPW